MQGSKCASGLVGRLALHSHTEPPPQLAGPSTLVWRSQRRSSCGSLAPVHARGLGRGQRPALRRDAPQFWFASLASLPPRGAKAIVATMRALPFPANLRYYAATHPPRTPTHTSVDDVRTSHSVARRTRVERRPPEWFGSTPRTAECPLRRPRPKRPTCQIRARYSSTLPPREFDVGSTRWSRAPVTAAPCHLVPHRQSSPCSPDIPYGPIAYSSLRCLPQQRSECLLTQTF